MNFIIYTQEIQLFNHQLDNAVKETNTSYDTRTLMQMSHMLTYVSKSGIMIEL